MSYKHTAFALKKKERRKKKSESRQCVSDSPYIL